MIEPGGTTLAGTMLAGELGAGRRDQCLSCLQTDASSGSTDAVVVDAPPDAETCPQAIDQRLGVCGPPITQCTDFFIFFTGQSAAQTFRPSNTGTISHLRLRMSNPAANTNPVQVSLIDLQNEEMALVNPNFEVEQHVLARVETPMTIAAAWQDVLFPRPAAVTSNQPYAILVRLVGTTDPGQIYAGWNEYNDYMGMADSYPRRRFFGCGTGCSQWIADPRTGTPPSRSTCRRACVPDRSFVRERYHVQRRSVSSSPRSIRPRITLRR